MIYTNIDNREIWIKKKELKVRVRVNETNISYNII